MKEKKCMEEKELRKKFNRDLERYPELKNSLQGKALIMRNDHVDKLLKDLSEGRIKNIEIKNVPNIFHFRKIAREEMISEIIAVNSNKN